MNVPLIRSTDPLPIYVPRGSGPTAGDLIIMHLPNRETPSGWTRHGDYVTRFATGDERWFPGPAAWFPPASLDAILNPEVAG